MVQHQTRVVELETRLQEGWSEEIHHEWENSKKQLQQLEAWRMRSYVANHEWIG